MGKVVGFITILAVAFVVGLWAAPGPGPAEIRTVLDTVAPADLEARIEDAEIENDGLRARLEAIESRPPRTVLRTDTLYREIPADTVFRVVTLRGGVLVTAPLFRRDSLWAPELHETDVGDCDEGFSVGPSGVVCDRPRLGHVYLGLTTLPSVSLSWTPTYRSRWGILAGYEFDDRRWFLGAQVRGW